MKDWEAKEDKSLSDFLNPKLNGRRLFAELWGTFLLVLVGAGAAIVGKYTGEVSKAMEVVAPGLMVMAIIYFMGAVSGAHINPAVTIAFALRQHFPWRRVPAYLIAQITGAILAATLLWSLFGTTSKLGATVPYPELDHWKAFAVEVVLTTGLVNTILGTASGARNVGNNGALAIGGYIALAGLWAGPLTGASMNPARTLGPDLVRGDLSTTWIYVLATLIGAFIAVGFEWILKGKPSTHASKEAQGGVEMKDQK
ncbi:MAG: aquaporin [Flavisolibacter sp.]|nr:aquaporin [Flavisolibacter sp.]